MPTEYFLEFIFYWSCFLQLDLYAFVSILIVLRKFFDSKISVLNAISWIVMCNSFIYFRELKEIYSYVKRHVQFLHSPMHVRKSMQLELKEYRSLLNEIRQEEIEQENMLEQSHIGVFHKQLL